MNFRVYQCSAEIAASYLDCRKVRPKSTQAILVFITEPQASSEKYTIVTASVQGQRESAKYELFNIPRR